MRLLVIATLLFSSSAIAQQTFVVLRDVPENPSIVIVPTNNSKDAIEYADKIEELVLSFRLKVVQRPTTRRVTQTQQATKSSPTDETNAVGAKSLTEEYYAYEETGADFLLLTDIEADRVKLLRVKSRELISTAKRLGGWQTPCCYEFNDKGEDEGFSEAVEYCLFKMLQAAGLPVRNESTLKK